MDQLENKRNEILLKLEEINKMKVDTENILLKTVEEIKEKVALHNQLVNSINTLKKDYKSKIEKFGVLKTLVKEYKKEQKESLEYEYKLQIKNIINFLNQLKFEIKPSIFRDFDSVRSTKTDMFPILHNKKAEFFNSQKIILKSEIFKEIKNAMFDPAALPNLIFFINFIIKYEIYFEETAFFNFIKKLIQKEFEYHFMSDKESNRLDKPEWFFEFLIKKYSEMEEIFHIYHDCCKKFSLNPKSIIDIITSTQELVFKKFTELLNIESSQKRNLILHFITQFKSFSSKITSHYDFELPNSQFKNMISTVQMQHIRKSLSEIHELKYVQWFEKYKELCRESINYINGFGDLDLSFQLKDVIVLILEHMRIFLENLRFINREEIKVAGFVFSELENLKIFLETEENDITTLNQNTIDNIVSSISKITRFNSDVFKLIKNLAINDTQNTLKRISYFPFASSEAKRTVIVEINKILDDYKICIYSDVIEKLVQNRVDLFLCNEILMKYKFTSQEYLEFRSFYSSIKKQFPECEWKADEICKSIDSIFEGRKLGTATFKAVEVLYNN